MTVSAQLAEILGPSGWLTGADCAGYRRDWLDRYGAAPLGVARPIHRDQLAQVMAICHRAGVAVVPQGGNTGLCGGAVCGAEGGVILSLARMTHISQPDLQSGTILVEAGVVLARLHEVLAPLGLIFPLHLGAEGTAQIGGLIGTNAGGSHAARYGMMQDLVLGLEVVLADGRVWDGLRAVQKDNAGYQLRKLFCGAEGTLGVVTRAVLRLFPAPKTRMTALLALPDTAALIETGARLRAQAGEFLSGLEFLCDLGVGFALRNLSGVTLPFETRAPWYLLVELTAGSPLVPLETIFETAMAQMMEEGLVLDGTIAQSDAQRAALWRLREEQPEAQRLEGPQLKHDLSVPPSQLGAFFAQAERAARQILPEVRLNPFGHLGDGNTHFNLSPPEGAGDFGAAAPEFSRVLGQIAADLGGSFAAEHGLGRAKRALAERLRSPVERAMMAAIKEAFDPKDLLNPDVIVARR